MLTAYFNLAYLQPDHNIKPFAAVIEARKFTLATHVTKSTFKWLIKVKNFYKRFISSTIVHAINYHCLPYLGGREMKTLALNTPLPARVDGTDDVL